MKKSTIIKRTALIMAFVLQFAALLWVGSYVLKLKTYEGVVTMTDFYAQQEDTCDVLILGSSHSGMNMDMSVLWEEYGISAYCLWGPYQPLWSTYHFLVEALKTQSPQVVILELFVADYPDEYLDVTGQQSNTVGLRMSKNKLEAIVANAEPENRLNILLEYPLYHTRISELEMEDFEHFPWSRDRVNYKGTEYRYGTRYIQPADASAVTEVKPIHEKAELYLRKMAQLCRQEGIDLVLVKTPSVNRDKEQPSYNHVAQLAREYDLPMINMNLMDAQTGITPGDYWMDGHMNTPGARKVTDWLGRYLKENYELADHRGDAAYASWDVHADNTRMGYLKAITGRRDYLEELALQDYSAILIKVGQPEKSGAWESMMEDLALLGISPQAEDDCWVIADAARPELVGYTAVDQICEFDYDGALFRVDYSEASSIRVNDWELAADLEEGFYLIMYDKNEMYCRDIVRFPVAQDLALVR